MMFEFRKPCRNKKRDHRQGGDSNCVGIPSCRQPLMYVWFNWPILRHVIWSWIYAACFISTIPSLCHVHLVVLDMLLTGRGIDIDAVMPAAHSLADHYGLASVTSHSCCPIFSFIANDQMAAVGAIYLSRAPHIGHFTSYVFIIACHLRWYWCLLIKLITQMLFDFLLIRIGENSKQNILS